LHILAEQFPGDLGRWLVRCLGFGHELVTQLGFQTFSTWLPSRRKSLRRSAPSDH